MQLHEQRNVLSTAIDRACEDLTDILSYLGSEKFQGDGNNWVNAGEMYMKLLRVRSDLTRRAIIDK